MRITGGRLAGRKIEPPLSLTTRPMMDRVRQALFNILMHHEWSPRIGSAVADARVLDAFCGTGALALEALSYGAAFATLFDQDKDALKIAHANVTHLGLQADCAIIATNSLRPPKADAPARLVFLCPPYKKQLVGSSWKALERAGWIDESALFVVETSRNEPFEMVEPARLVLSRSYGDTSLHFLEK